MVRFIKHTKDDQNIFTRIAKVYMQTINRIKFIIDFRSSNGLYGKIKHQYSGTFHLGKDVFDANLLKTNESTEAFNLFMGELKELIVNAKPIVTHFLIKKLADMKKLKRICAQNIDSLEELVGLNVDWQFERVKNYQAQQFHNIFEQGEASNCPECEEKGLEIGKIAKHDKKKADCLIIMETSLRIPDVKAFIKDFASAVHNHKGFVILVNATDIVTKEWDGLIDFQIEGDCDE
ncbi:DHS-like NAD/FAD-binding domain-containing protein [Gigaspora rosea]|uniref:DHS-like NAD/FAD-binding domain-containing protein n=1 Tax=Gigaspora rosea TaxID=44941 RepID=A0A397V7C7_9GLOM|nr:DHS-like NAD/FAD-binding domain-containing protein [Gigaspora rosea]